MSAYVSKIIALREKVERISLEIAATKDMSVLAECLKTRRVPEHVVKREAYLKGYCANHWEAAKIKVAEKQSKIPKMRERVQRAESKILKTKMERVWSPDEAALLYFSGAL